MDLDESQKISSLTLSQKYIHKHISIQARHLGLLLQTDLPELWSLNYAIEDASENLEDLLDAIQHVVEMQIASLPS